MSLSLLHIGATVAALGLMALVIVFRKGTFGLLAAAASEATVRLPETPFWPAVIATSALVLLVGAWLFRMYGPAFTADVAA